ncbi:glycerophosphodiester phosphodiesterase [Desulfovibrio sp. OttesenSCG-928-I05]|nr:glycerophosphodiester phosphodiesterase [Desulfovibrio sp. OttesenSCG-928-I05]
MHTPLIIAHRGARGHAPENTLAACRLAHAEGSHMWELDTGYTSDGKLIVIHDDSLARTTDVSTRPEFAQRDPWHIYAFTLEEIRTLDAGSWFAAQDPFGMIAAGEVSDAMLESYAGERIPTLEEALVLTKELAQTRPWRVNVEIKDHAGRIGHETITHDVVELIRSLGMQDMVVLSSFQHRYLLEAADLMPEMKRGVLVESERPDDSTALCREKKGDFYHPEQILLADGETAALAEAGIGVNPWTVNKVADMQRCINTGAYGIITDFPARLRELLKAQPPSPDAVL